MLRIHNIVGEQDPDDLLYCESEAWNLWTFFYPMRPHEPRSCQIQKVEK